MDIYSADNTFSSSLTKMSATSSIINTTFSSPMPQEIEGNIETYIVQAVDPAVAVPVLAINIIVGLIGEYNNFLVFRMVKRDNSFSNSLLHGYAICNMVAIPFVVAFLFVFLPFYNPASEYLGDWFCHISSFTFYFMGFYMWLHSLLVSIMRYLYMVQYVKLLHFGLSRAETIFNRISWIVPLILTVLHHSMRTDYDAVPPINYCYKRSYDISTYDMWTLTKRKFCVYNEYDFSDMLGDWSNSFEEFVRVSCGITGFICLIIFSNMMEGFFYWRIYVQVQR